MDPVVKQQVTERLRQSEEILVTVSANPLVDQLAACIGTTLLLNKLGKHATAIFSGTIPSTLEFLQPEKTIEHDIDNLRDFIISLDKSKADKLHFKVEGDVVRIYITPYKTTLSQTDLSYGQGDYNVETILALGVQNRNQVDAALSAHGRVLHDAAIIAVTAGAGKPSDVGQINWQDTAASSLCEMMVSISEAFGSGLIDAQMATAFLTGIVAETERFRNTKTTPKVMTMSAQLMAAGANQQLIASKLDLPANPPAAAPQPKAATEGTLQLDHQTEKVVPPKQSLKIESKPIDKKPVEPEIKLDSEDKINIDTEGNLSQVSTASSPASKSNFVPAPPDFKPPNGSTPAIPPVGASSPAPLPDDIPLPGEHSLLDPQHHQPSFSSPLSAASHPEWGADGQPAESAILGDEEKRQTKSLEDARANLHSVFEDEPSSPSNTPSDQPSPEAAAPVSGQDKPAQAPPLPPPLPPSVIEGTDQSSSQTK